MNSLGMTLHIIFSLSLIGESKHLYDCDGILCIFCSSRSHIHFLNKLCRFTDNVLLGDGYSKLYYNIAVVCGHLRQAFSTFTSRFYSPVQLFDGSCSIATN